MLTALKLTGLKLYSRSFLGNGNDLLKSAITEPSTKNVDNFITAIKAIKNDVTSMEVPYASQFTEIKNAMGNTKTKFVYNSGANFNI